MPKKFPNWNVFVQVRNIFSNLAEFSGQKIWLSPKIFWDLSKFQNDENLAKSKQFLGLVRISKWWKLCKVQKFFGTWPNYQQFFLLTIKVHQFFTPFGLPNWKKHLTIIAIHHFDTIHPIFPAQKHTPFARLVPQKILSDRQSHIFPHWQWAKRYFKPLSCW